MAKEICNDCILKDECSHDSSLREDCIVRDYSYYESSEEESKK